MIFFLAAQLDNGGISGGEVIALLLTASATLVTAIGGFILVFRKANATEQKVDASAATVTKVYEHVNGIEADDVKLGDAVRELRRDVRSIKREMGIDGESR